MTLENDECQSTNDEVSSLGHLAIDWSFGFCH